jgi:DNA replication and repair protein RecF
VHVQQLRLRDFRNYARLDAEFAPGFHLLVGDNAQGKTNILEAIYLLATLRSFRGAASQQMVRHGQKGYFVGAKAQGHGASEIKMYWSSRERQLSLNGQPVKRLTEYLGTLRTVVFCTEDLQIIKGTGRNRRRFMDLLLSQTYPAYLPTLQRYARALRSRNALLKRPIQDAAALEGFTAELIKSGSEIIRWRAELVPKFLPIAAGAYRRIAQGAEALGLAYEPSVQGNFELALAQARDRERAARMTLVGPHRDDLRLLIDDRAAAEFGSEGQKRTAAIALKMAQAEYLTNLHGFAPVLLIDDIMGELDVHRRSGLIPLLERTHHAQGQVFMTATEENWPAELGRSLTRWEVRSGTLKKSAL